MKDRQTTKRAAEPFKSRGYRNEGGSYGQEHGNGKDGFEAREIDKPAARRKHRPKGIKSVDQGV